MFFLCYSQVVRDGIFGDCSFYFAFVVYIINIQKKNEELLFEQIESIVSKMREYLLIIEKKFLNYFRPMFRLCRNQIVGSSKQNV